MRYGPNSLAIAGLAGECRGVLAPEVHRPAESAERLTETAMERPIGSAPLVELCRPNQRAAILVSGRDRVTRADVFVPLLLRHLKRAGIPAGNVTIFMATGTHIRFTDADRVTIFGDGLPDEVRVIAHDCRAEPDLVRLGVSSFGNELWVNRTAYESDIKILTGRITHHYFAGFTAGCKAVLPGVSGFETIKRNHRKVLSGTGDNPRHPAARSGNVQGNPIHDEMLEASALFDSTFVLNTVLNTDHELTDVFCGDPRLAHEKGCEVVDSRFTLLAGSRTRAAVASCGGAPYDCSFTQALKAIFHTAPCIADNGGLLLLAQCPEGVAPGFLRWDRSLTLPQLASTVLENYDLTGHNTYLLREALSRIRIAMVSSLPPEQVAALGIIPASTVQEGWDLLRERISWAAPDYYVVPYGNLTSITTTA